MSDNAELWKEVRDTSRALASHLGECRESNRAFGRDIQGLKRVVWWAGTALIAGQTALLIKLLFFNHGGL